MDQQWHKSGAQERNAYSQDHSSTSVPVRANSAPLNDNGNNSGLPNPSSGSLGVLTALSPAALVYDNINAATSADILDNFARAVWHHYEKGAMR
jgi:hypothetical protein